ncbi:iron chelate uptake ABC transporter family permease subunit [Nocardia otitidiscaviarum]|uniref:Iron chelate uptake ABC transporter family permease subunit n=1 Tax=Nocardia otitidiscaviarum TaxID=1823 RepID=A0A516NH85_9NOCA|nr:iron chelate uptake ABC transporter family permease subunit [Nocardia otitidiscaviarum]MCP9623507.1 iron chelate uptake ABC transporter family permease subunit [Nocardia otitidiscaviarum]QDP78263.1 iron chelate uptake ABC transporter family permease subunit [Nocardia otitidiscaviarum]
MSTETDFGRTTLVVRARGRSARMGLRTAVVCAALLAAALGVAVLALGTGDYAIPPDRVVRALFSGDNRFDRLVVWEWRFPRVLLALALGAALGVSGAILQSVTRNPLGSPDIVGFNTGAYTGALIVILTVGGGNFQTAAGALIGGLGAALAIQLLAFRHHVSGFRLIIVGIGVSAMLASVNTWLILRADLHAAMSAAAWGAGSLNGLSWPQVGPALLILAVLTIAVIPAAPRLRMLELGDDLAHAFGIRVGRARMLLIVLSVALTATATAVAGPIAFVALAAPQLGRRLARTPSTALAPAAAMGALLLVACDWMAQRAFAPTTLPVGVVTVSIGGLYLAYLLVAEARRN